MSEIISKHYAIMDNFPFDFSEYMWFKQLYNVYFFRNAEKLLSMWLIIVTKINLIILQYI